MMMHTALKTSKCPFLDEWVRPILFRAAPLFWFVRFLNRWPKDCFPTILQKTINFLRHIFHAARANIHTWTSKWNDFLDCQVNCYGKIFFDKVAFFCCEFTIWNIGTQWMIRFVLRHCVSLKPAGFWCLIGFFS